MMPGARVLPFWLGLLGVVAAGCRPPAPRPISYGNEACARCHMTITDPRYAAELVTTSGRVEVFDDIGCLAAFVQAGTGSAARIHSLWVHPVKTPDQWLEATGAAYLERPDASTPMASGVLAFASAAEADSARAAGGGTVRRWADLLRRPPKGVPG